MDIVSKVPLEISLHIFSFLPFRDLFSCFKVCKGWREIANCNLLWKKHCLPYATEDEIKKACSRVDRSIPTTDLPVRFRYCLRKRINKPLRCNLDPWCGCARLFKYKYRKHLRNWKNGKFVCSQLMLLKPEFNVVCSRRTLRLCFYQPHVFGIIDILASGIKDVGCLEIPLPEEAQYDSVQISPHYLAVSYRNIVLIYKKKPDEYKSYRTLALHNEQLETEGTGQFVESSTRDRTFTVILICGHYAWFRSISNLYIINLESGVTKKKICFENSHVKHDGNNKVVAWSKGHIRIFNVHGHLLHQRKVRSQIEYVAFEETYALLCRAKNNAKAYIEWWDPQTAKRRVLMRVEGVTSMVVRGENVFILEVDGECSSKVSAIHSVSGITYWVHTISMDTFLHSENTIFEGICGKYLFVYVPSLNNRKFYLIDMNTGVGLYTKEFGDGKAFLFNEKIVVIARNQNLWIMNYL